MNRKYDNESIMSLDGLNHIRFRPGMFGVDAYSKQGIYLLVKEIIDNSVDEARMDPNNKHIIKICFIRKRNTFQCIVEDRGRGVPLDMIVPIFTKPGTSGKWKEGYDASGGTHGVGAKATVAMSRFISTITSRYGEGLAALTVEDCKVTHHIVDKRNKNNPSGTVFIFEPDPAYMVNAHEFFEENNAYDDIRQLLEFISVFVPNIVFEISEYNVPFKAEQFKGSCKDIYSLLTNIPSNIIATTEHRDDPSQYMLKVNGITSRVIWDSSTIKQDTILVPVVIDTGKSDNKKEKIINKKLSYEVRLFITSDFALRPSCVLGAVNMININDKKSVHIQGLEDAIKAHIDPFIKDQLKTFFNESYNIPIHLISIVNWQHATFTGQHKHRFTNSDFHKGFVDSLNSNFAQLGEEFWRNLYNLIADDIVVKYERKNKLDLNILSSDKNLAFELNTLGCYYECRSSDRSITELLICEGISAGDYVKQLRNADTQAVFELKGKPVNTLKMAFSEAMKNKIYNDLVKVLGTTPSDTELQDFRFNKIMILADGDPDGYHITSLIVGILYSINPRLLSSGRVMVASPPLYIVKFKNNAMFVRDNKALLDLKAEGYRAVLDISLVVDDKPAYLLEGEYFRSFCHLIEHLGTIFNSVATKLNIDACILEQLVHVVDDIDNLNTKAICDKLGLKDCTYEKSSNVLILNIGDIDMVVPLNGLVSDIRKYIIPELNKINYDRINFLVNTKLTDLYRDEYLSIMELYSIFNIINKEYGISRMKGLGEMDRHHLKLTCLDPATRTYMQIYNIGDIDKIFMLMGVDTNLRKQLVMKNVK